LFAKVIKMNLTGKSIICEEFIAFDLETTGLHPVMDRIIEFGAVRFRGDGAVLDSFQQLIDPRCAISAGATAVNGITNEMVAGQPTIEKVLPGFIDFIGNEPTVMMAHNAGFDMGFLSAALSRLGMESPLHPVVDTCALARRRLNLVNYRLETIGRHLRLINSAEHRALEDSLLLKDIFLHLIRLSPVISSIDELLRVTPVLRFRTFEEMAGQLPPGFEELWEAIVKDQDVVIEYLGGSTPGSARVVTPLGVTETGGRIYLAAFCHNSGMNKTFRLGRVVSYRINSAR